MCFQCFVIYAVDYEEYLNKSCASEHIVLVFVYAAGGGWIV